MTEVFSDSIRVWRSTVGIVAISALITSCTPETSARIGGETRWVSVANGQLKTQVFSREAAGRRPILVLILHGDIPDPRPDYQYIFAKIITTGLPESPARSEALRSALGEVWEDEDIVAAGILRPGSPSQ